MFIKANETIEYCKENNLRLYDLVIRDEIKASNTTEENIRAELLEMYRVMKESAEANLHEPSKTAMGMIDGFAYRMHEYSKCGDSITGEFLTEAMAMAFSTLELSSSMGKIVASPTAGSSGILPAALYSLQLKKDYTDEEIVNAMLTAVGAGKFIGRYGSFAGAEGGCQAETGSGAAMAAAAAVELYGGTVEQIFHAASFAFIHVLGLVCDPIAGLVEYPCTYRNASGVMNAFISADMALAGVVSIVPFEEVCMTAGEVGRGLPSTLRETALGGLAATDTAQKYNQKFIDLGVKED